MEQRLVDLEVRYTHLEQQLSELSQVVFEQQKQLDRMAKEIVSLRARLGDEDNGQDQPPPHY
jgi:uncharacterized coiled-coil protein SlyX